MAANVPNPFTPLAFLPPEEAEQYETSSYVVVAGLTAFLWDWFLSLPNEYKFLRKSGFGGLTSVYFVSRLATLAYCVGRTVFISGNVAHCQALLYITGSFYVVAMPATSLLFYFRVRSVWSKSPTISAFFGGLWLGSLGSSFMALLAVNGTHIGLTKRCISPAIQSYVSTPIVLNAINDTLVFIIIAVRVAQTSVGGDTSRTRSRFGLTGNGLLRLCQGLWQSGLLYYFATVGISIIVSAVVLSPSVVPAYRAMLTVPNIVVENAMACRVFRDIKLGVIKDAANSYNLDSSGVHSSNVGLSAGGDIALQDASDKPPARNSDLGDRA